MVNGKLNGASFINQIDWTLQNGPLKPNQLYADKLNLIEEEKSELAESIYNSIIRNANIKKVHQSLQNCLLVTQVFIQNRTISPGYLLVCLFIIPSKALISLSNCL